MNYRLILSCLLILTLFGCESTEINSPYSQADVSKKILYTSFSLRPKHLDPARSYSANETTITGQVYEPPYQYHYLKRPYELEPLTASEMPKLSYLDKQFKKVDENSAEVAYTEYDISIKPGIYYQPHPAFVKDKTGHWLYHHLSEQQLDKIHTLADFEQTATRELKAEDFVFQVKRLALPEIHSPILGLMSEYIVGLKEYAGKLRDMKQKSQPIHLRDNAISGVTVIDDYHYRIRVYGKYPQLRYWLAMPFFAPIPWEAEDFYQQQGLREKNITLDWFPVGTGPFYMTENNPNQRIVLTKNPNFHADFYPFEGEASDRKNGLLDAAGQPLPFIDQIVFSLEKEGTSYWAKFLQGYYDVSGISSDSFDQAVQMSSSGEFGLSDKMKQKNIQLRTAIATTSFYMGFNMLDPVVGGDSNRAKLLRRAISIAVDYEEYISIFRNGRGIPAQGPIPPGIFGYKEGGQGVNSYVYQWGQGVPKRKSIDEAKQLLAEAGYPDGRDVNTGEPLVLYFDVPAAGPGNKADLDWLRKQFKKLNLQLVIRSTDYNRFQDKMRQGKTQIFQWGWNADYPDPENFLFLLYGPNAKMDSGGENVSNYANTEFDRLFEKMRVMPNSPTRDAIIQKMVAIVREDAPWVWGFHPKDFALFHVWNKNVKPNLMANNTLKYRDIDVELRQRMRAQWNQPVFWPLAVVTLIGFVLLIPAMLVYRIKKHKKL